MTKDIIYVLDTDGSPLAQTHKHKHTHMLVKIGKDKSSRSK